MERIIIDSFYKIGKSYDIKYFVCKEIINNDYKKIKLFQVHCMDRISGTTKRRFEIYNHNGYKYKVLFAHAGYPLSVKIIEGD